MGASGVGYGKHRSGEHFRRGSSQGMAADLRGRLVAARDLVDRTLANHCVHCGAVQEDYRLHSEPGSVAFTPLVGLVRMSGDFGFGV